MTPEITNAPLEFKDQITAFCRATYEAHRKANPEQWPGDFFEKIIAPTIEQRFRDAKGGVLQSSPTIFVAKVDGDLAGYYRLSHIPKDDGFSYYSVDLEDIYVVEAFRGKGIGAALLGHAKGQLKDGDWDRLNATVADWNTGSRALFENGGFTVKSRALSFGPDRPQRNLPDTKTQSRWRQWSYPAVVIVLSLLLIASIQR